MFKQACLALATGVLAGLAATLFLILLAAATTAREANPLLIFALPLAGLAIGWLYHTYGKDSEPGTNLILDEMHNPKKTLPLKMAPLILFSTVITHLFGGSAGREGTAVQMGASLADQLSKWTELTPARRTALLRAGAGAGFGAAIGTPIAGMIFGLEVICGGAAWMECLIASFTAYGTTLLLHAPHTHYPPIAIPQFNFSDLSYVAGAAVLFGLSARAFVTLTHLIEKLQKRWIKFPPLRPALAGVILSAIYLTVTSTQRYAGLGLSTIQGALLESAKWYDPVLKALFTALTIGSGFKGGEFIPLVFIGTTLGSALGSPLLAAVGLAAVFGAAANTPIACAIMAMEIFGPAIAPYTLLGCVVAFLVSGRTGIYASQPLEPGHFLLGWRGKLR